MNQFKFAKDENSCAVETVKKYISINGAPLFFSLQK